MKNSDSRTAKRYTGRTSPYVPHLKVKRSSSGLGLCTTTLIHNGDFIIEYIGERITDAEADERDNKYLFDVSKNVVIDGSTRANLARYINHSCRPNCETDVVRGHVYVYARRTIKAGEELVYDYGKEYFDDHIKPHGCRCEKCKGK